MGLSRFLFQVPAASERVVDVTAAWVYVVAISHIVELGVDHDHAGPVEAGTWWQPPRPFRQVRVRNSAAVPCSVELKVGDGDFEDRRGEGGGATGIEPVEVGDMRAYGRRAQRTNPAAAGDYATTQLFNPADSGVLGVVRSIYVHSSVGGEIVLHDHQGALPDEFAVAISRETRSVYFGDPNGALRWKRGNDSTPLVHSLGTYLFTLRLPALGYRSLALQTPLLIPPGWGLVCRHQEVGPLDLDFGAELLELPESS